MRHAVDRRTVLVAAGAGLLQACSDDDPDALAPGRRRRQGRRGKGDRAEPGRTRLTQDDLDEVAARLSTLLDGDDRQAFVDYARPADAVQWERMWDGLHTVPTLDRTFWLQRADGSWVNQRGGPVTATLRGVVSYRIDGCDAEPMAHLCDLSVFKPARGPVRVQTLGPLRDETEAPWLLAPVACEVGSHAVLISRVQDAATARGILDQVDAGARRAMDVVAAPAGVSRICVTLGWPQARDRLYGGSQGDFIGSAHGYRYVDPQQLADTGERGAGESVRGLAGGDRPRRHQRPGRGAGRGPRVGARPGLPVGAVRPAAVRRGAGPLRRARTRGHRARRARPRSRPLRGLRPAGHRATGQAGVLRPHLAGGQLHRGCGDLRLRRAGRRASPRCSTWCGRPTRARPTRPPRSSAPPSVTCCARCGAGWRTTE